MVVFFFFDELYERENVRKAFKMICLDKMLSDGYFDMNEYINRRIRKEDMQHCLSAGGSPYAVLYNEAYPKPEEVVEFWDEHVEEFAGSDLTSDEAKAIVNWVYRIYVKIEDRVDFTKSIFITLKELHRIQHNIQYSGGVIYNDAKVEIHFISSVTELNKYISTFQARPGTLFFRGHSNPNFILCPSIMRSGRLERNESKLYREIQVECPDEFEGCHTHIEKLVKMQHYGLPTRLLDITRNPLVGLYFACESNQENLGELIVVSAENHEMKYPQSDTVSILASLAALSNRHQQSLYEAAMNSIGNNLMFARYSEKLLQEIRTEKPGFQSELEGNVITQSCIVLAHKANKRITKQDGAFILCGLLEDKHSLESFRYQKNDKKVVLLIKNKQQILEQLDAFSINHTSLFPEIECVAEYLRNKYI